MGEKVRFGIVGCGKVGRLHAQALRQLEGAELAAACGRTMEKAKPFAEEFGIPAYDGVERMIREAGVGAVVICTPHPSHADTAVQAARLGACVIVEKPLASTLADCDRIIEAVRESGVTGATVSQRRFYEPAVRMKKAIGDEKIGRPILGTVNMMGWRDAAYYASDPWRGTWLGEGGGVLVNQSPHQLDLLLWYMGDIDELYGTWDNLNHPGLEVDDTAAAIIRFRSGALGSLVVSNSANPALFGNVRVHGSNGACVGVQTDGGAMFIAGMSGITEPPVNDLWTVPGEEQLLEEYRKQDAKSFLEGDPILKYFKLQHSDFIASIREGRPPAVTLGDGRKVVELFTAVYRSKRDGCAVKFPLEPENRPDLDGRLKG